MSAAGAAPPKRDRLEEFALGLQAPSGPILDPLDALLDANSRAGPHSAAGARQGANLASQIPRAIALLHATRKKLQRYPGQEMRATLPTA